MKKLLFVLAILTSPFSMAQAAALSAMPDATVAATIVVVPKVDVQIAEWTHIFAAHRGQDLATVPMPELMEKVHQTVAYVTPAIQDEESQEIFKRYVGEVTAAHAGNTLTFDLYTRFILGAATLMNPEKWKDSKGPFRLGLAASLRAPLASAEWLGTEPYYDHLRGYNDVLSMLKFGMDPCFVLVPGGHFGYGRIVRGGLEPKVPQHFMGVPLNTSPMAHGATRTVSNFIGHDAGHGKGFTKAFAAIWPLVRAIFGPVLDTPPVDGALQRRDTAGLYFLLHETGTIAEDLHGAVQSNLDGSGKDLGHAILEVVKKHFVNEVLDEFLGMWSSIFCQGRGFGLRAKEDVVMTKDAIHFKGTIHHGLPNGILDPSDASHIPSVDLERGSFIINLPSFALEGVYTVEVEPKESHVDALREKYSPEVFTHYERALAEFYKGAVALDTQEGAPKKYRIKLTPTMPYMEGSPGAIQNIFDGGHVDELGTKHWVETGKYDAPKLTYAWGTVLEVREFFDKLFTDLQRDWKPIWAAQPPLDPALIASTRTALDTYFAKKTSAGTEGSDAAAFGSGGASASAAGAMA